MTIPGQGVLESFIGDVLEDDYSGVEPGAPSSKGARIATLIVTAAIGLAMAAALVLSISTSDQRAGVRSALVDRIDAVSAEVSARQAAVDRLRGRVESQQDRLLQADAGAPDTARQLEGLAPGAAAAALAGPGVTVTLSDAPNAQGGSRVLDRDLQDVTNALWKAGASGLAVNGNRITAVTAIRSAGEAILVNYEPLSPPYVVSAVGATGALAPGSDLQRLLTVLSRDYGLVTHSDAADVSLPAGEVRQPRFASTAATSGSPG